MNIGFDFRMGGTRHGGIGRYVSELLRAMVTQAKNDRFIVFYNDQSDPTEIALLHEQVNVELVLVAARHYSIAEQTVFLRVLQQHALDVVHFPNFNHPIFYKRPFVVTVHDMVHHRISGHKKSRWLFFQAYKKEMEHAVVGSRAVIAPTEAAKADILSYFPDVAKKTQVIYEGTTLTEQSRQKVEAVKKQFLLRRPYFLFVGTLERKKNIVGLARGFEALREKYNLDVDLVFAGKADPHYPEEKFRALVGKHKDHIVFTGYVEDDTLAALYQGAHAYANASLNEGFGLPGVEAMHFGLPLAVANTAVFTEVYDDAAVYFDPTDPDDIANQLRLLATDKQFYEQKQERAVARARMFSWERAATETLTVLHGAANGSGVSPAIPVSLPYVVHLEEKATS
ncbi:MAG: glycosyltransferase family 4 protein [Candidatus Doudnabacteria bacterium]|nr:glycosyltransferase family 4 protein [Candidatus Doudnabacteria bacterium]